MNQHCRFCEHPLSYTFANLGMSPLANSLLKKEHLNSAENFYPLHCYVCDNCFLVQLEEFASPHNIFHDYVYFSSYSDSWLNHAKEYVDLVTERFQLDQHSQVIEIASNDGYLLQYFQTKKIPVLGIEPAHNVAQVAQQKNIPTITKFFGVETSQELIQEGYQADLLIGNNVLAHVPKLNDFVAGMKLILKPEGILTMEFPHLLQLIEQNQFDTIYHEHFSYFSFLTAEKIFSRHGLRIFDVEEIPTHGGSLRIYAKHEDNNITLTSTDRLEKLKRKEKEAKLHELNTYLAFNEKVKATKRQLIQFLIRIKEEDKTIVAYGAPAKGNTLLNYCGIGIDFLEYTVDRSPHKQDLYLPGTHIPIYSPEKIKETKPDYVLILPWNLKEEIIKQMSYIRDWGGKFLIAIPQVTII